MMIIEKKIVKSEDGSFWFDMYVILLFYFYSLEFTTSISKTIKKALKNIAMSIILLYMKLGIFERKRMRDEKHTNVCENFHVGMDYSQSGLNPRSNKQKSNCCEKKLVAEWCSSVLPFKNNRIKTHKNSGLRFLKLSVVSFHMVYLCLCHCFYFGC